MGWFTYKCPEHGDFKISLQKRASYCKCPKCQADSSAIIKTGSVSIVERLDNGAMSRAVERMPDIDKIMEERCKKHDDETIGSLPDPDET